MAKWAFNAQNAQCVINTGTENECQVGLSSQEEPNHLDSINKEKESGQTEEKGKRRESMMKERRWEIVRNEGVGEIGKFIYG